MNEFRYLIDKNNDPKDELIYMCISYLEHLGFSFMQKKGKHVSVEFNSEEYKWKQEQPFKIFNEKGVFLDIFKDIYRSTPFKKLWGEICDEDLKKIYNNDPLEYQVHVNTQNLDNRREDVINFLDNYKFLRISSPMATRKSNIIRETLNQSNKRGLKSLLITPRVSLARDISLKYKDFNVKMYNDKTYKVGDNLVVQFDSLYKFDPDNFDIVILDEVTSLLLYMTETFEGKEKIHFDNVKTFAKMKNKKFVLSDAFIIDFPFKMDKKNTLGIFNHFRENLRVIEYEYKNTFTGKIFRELKNIRENKRKELISISSNEKRFLVNLENKLTKMGYKCLLLHGDTENKDLIYEEFKKKQSEYDVFLYSPTLTVGVSLMSNISHHFHYDISGTIDVISSLQMIRRSRNARNIHYFIRGRSSFKPTDLEEMERSLPNSFRVINEYGEIFGTNIIGKILIFVRRIKNVLDNSHKYAFRDLLSFQFQETRINNLKS